MPERNMSHTLAAESLSVGYGGSLVIDSLDMDIEPGKLTALVGPNGSGKSTLLRAFARLVPLRRGAVKVDGKSTAGMASKSLARRVGMLSQGPTAPEGMTVQDLVRQGRYPHRSIFSPWSVQDGAACEDALRQTNMLDLRERLLHSLSGGQRQRAWIAMTLAQQTDILLLDEPTTFLDIAHQIEILELMEHLVTTQGKTIVAVLHDLNQAARHADRIAFLKDGRLLAHGTTATVMNGEMIEAAFGVKCNVISDPFHSKPLFLLKHKRALNGCNPPYRSQCDKPECHIPASATDMLNHLVMF